MTRTGINWLLIHDHLKVNIMLPCVHHEGTWGSGVTTTLILNCSQPHVMAALSPNPMEMHGPTFASCDVKIKPQAMDNLFKGLAVITYCMKACYSRVHITSLFALFSLVSIYIYIYIYIYIGFKTFCYLVRHLDSTASYLPTGLHLGFFCS